MKNDVKLRYAIKNGSVDAIRSYIAEGTQLEASDPSGRTPIWYAAESGHMEVLRIIMDSLPSSEKSVKVDETDNNGTSPLMVAVKEGHSSLVEFLLPLSPDPLKKNEAGFNCLHIACGHSSKDMVRLLLRHGFAVNDLTDTGRSPLRLATIRRDLEIVELLLDESSDPNLADINGVTPLHEACYWGNEDAIRLLINAGADPNNMTCTGVNAYQSCDDVNLREKIREMTQSAASILARNIANLGPQKDAAIEAQPPHSTETPPPSPHTSYGQRSIAISDEKWVRHEFLCPITQEVMEDPVICMDGFTYERSSISAWFSQHNTSPTTNAVLESTTLIPNNALKALIASEREAARIS